jgi:heme exporter protein A
MEGMIPHLPKKLVAERKLVVERLSVMRGPRPIFRGISFSVAAGEALVLTGANGVGKTTLMRAVAGFLPLHEGRIRLEGADDDSPIGDFCHYVGHLNGVKRSLTVMDTLRFFAAFLGGDASLAEDAAGLLGLGALGDVPAGYLSAGQKRRLALGRLVCAKRPLWLLDEPTVSLDVRSQELLAQIVNAHLAAGGIVLAATHIHLGWQNLTAFDLERARADALSRVTP